MAVAWTVFQFFMILTYFSLDEIGLSHEDDQAETEKLLRLDDSAKGEESIPLPMEGTASTAHIDSRGRLRLMLSRYCDELVDDGIVVCWAMFFLTFFLQTNNETTLTPLMEKFFHFGPFENSVAFGVIGAIVVFVSIVVGLLGKWKVDDRRLALTGLLLLTLATLGSVVLYPVGDFGQNYLLAYFSVGVGTYVVGHSIFFISSSSIYSKIVKSHSMGFAMGIRGSLIGLGMILGPLWSGGLFDNLYVMCGMNLFLCLFVMSLLVLSYKRMVRY